MGKPLHRRSHYTLIVLAVVSWLGLAVPAKTAQPQSASKEPPAKTAAPAESAAAPAKTAVPAEAAAAPAKPPMLRFQFRFQPWKDVLQWFAQQADLSLVMDSTPQGTFNFSDNREYTPAEAIDLLNGVLLTKGYTLIRHGRMLMLVNLEDGIPPNLVPTVPVDSLDSKGEFELVSVLFNLERLKADEAETEIKRLLGPQGSAVALSKSQQLFVTETAGRLRAIRDVLARIDNPDSGSAGVRTFTLRYARTEDVLPILRQMLDIPEDKAAAADGSLRIAVEGGGERILVSGRAEKVARAAEILKGLDVPGPGGEASARGTAPQLEVYPVSGSDPQAVLSVMQTLMVGQTDVRLTVDTKNGSLIALARPAQQATIRATLARMQQEGQQVEVIRLSQVDPQTAVLSINKLFASADGKPSANSPQVDADPSSRQLMIRGTPAQIKQIRSLLEQMGESLSAAGNQPQTGGGSASPTATVFYLKNAKAAALAETLEQVFGSGSAAPSTAPTSSAADSAGAMARFGGGRNFLATGPIKITADPRLNALVVQANRTDIEHIEQMLKILDQKESPEDVTVASKPRMIAIQYGRAQEIADIVREVYADRLIEPSAANRQPQLPWFMMGRRGSEQQQQPTKRDDAAKLSVGVDSRTNSLIVVAADPLFSEVKQMVEELDTAASEQDQTVRVVTLHQTSAAAVEQALSAIAGDSVDMNRTGSATNAANPATSSSSSSRFSSSSSRPGSSTATSSTSSSSTSNPQGPPGTSGRRSRWFQPPQSSPSR
jgi:type II secretory pathway component GspD/PulD (secretin)